MSESRMSRPRTHRTGRAGPGRFARFALLASLALVASGMIAPTAARLAAQDVYTLTPASGLTFGCTGPSPCLCPVLFVGTPSGSFVLTPVLPPLGPIFEYTVSDFTATTVAPDGTTTTIEGSGLWTFDVAALTQVLVLDTTMNGVPATFESTGAVPLASSDLATVSIDVFHPIDACLYDGLHLEATAPLATEFIRGDVNEDGGLNLADAIGVLTFIFPPSTLVSDCADAQDVNDDGVVNIADPITLLAGLFSGGPSPPAPYPDCGVDPTVDAIDCGSHAACP